MNYSTTLLRLTKVVLLAATLLGYCVSLPVVSRPAAMAAGLSETSKAPKLKQLQETSQAATRTHHFPANSIDSLDRDMREAETTTTAEVMAETTPGMASGSESGLETTTGPAQDEVESTQTAPRTERSPQSPRDNFKNILRSYYYTNPQSRGREELTSFFSLSEMYRLGPLSTNPDVDLPPPQPVVERIETQCQRMAGNLNTTPNDNDYCHWTYTCNFNPNRFPSMIINATECTPKHGAMCVQRVTKIQTFTRTFSNGIDPTWTQDDELVSVVYAYTCRTRH